MEAGEFYAHSLDDQPASVWHRLNAVCHTLTGLVAGLAPVWDSPSRSPPFFAFVQLLPSRYTGVSDLRLRAG